ncbi:diguanylate cyclase [Ideonella sp.]|jgi:diguanylate cyclase|uniref:diguanylate cyclase n=1 Tax=Ideonella sp. TaxID=1929293 RepID=UPI0037BFA541
MTASSELTPAQIAKAALRRLALARQEPTPENYAQAWAEESGHGRAQASLPAQAKPLMERMAARLVEAAEARDELLKHLLQGDWNEASRVLERAGETSAHQAQALAQVIDRMAKGLERGGKQWTLARKKDSLQRVLDANRSDVQRLTHRLRQLVHSWDDGDMPVEPVADSAEHAPIAQMPEAAPSTAAAVPTSWPQVLHPLQHTVRLALPSDQPRAVALADELAALADQIAQHGATAPLARAVAEVCDKAGRLLSHRHHLLDQVHLLSQELAGSLAELAEDDSWVQGQLNSLRQRLDERPNARAVQSASSLLAEARLRQRDVRQERNSARLALKELIRRMLHELGELDQHTGRLSDGMQRYMSTIEQADSLESLAGVVREMLDEGREVHGLVSSTRERLNGEHARAVELEERVRELETELRRLSDEVATDALTQIANRRGMMQAFEVEQARMRREGGELSVGLLDIDNFKKLNDSLGHAAGDQALIALAQYVRDALRPIDIVARFGGEEFVVLLPSTPVEEAQKTLTRLQRQMSASLFMHEGKDVLVTFSAGVTAYRFSEALGDALERADEALYEAKRTGKNRTCMA